MDSQGFFGPIYECKLHKKINDGLKRDNFQEQYYNTLLNVSMGLSMRLYKEVNVKCDCPENYAAFDLICKDILKSGQTPKDS
jgi:hypothetical protein